MQTNEIIEIMIAKGYSLATAESCTGGLIGKIITDVPGASEIFGYGMVTYSNEAKMKVLGVKAETLNLYGAVSPQTAEEMALGLKKLSGADYAVSVTGIAGPGGGSVEKPVGLVYMGVASAKGVSVKKNLFSGNREDIRRQTTETALAFVAEVAEL